MKVLITGGNGYIAKSLYASLSDSYEITLITRKDFDLRNSMQTTAWFSDKMFDVVIHTAIVGGNRLKVDTAEVLDSNLRMYYNILDNKDSFSKFISIGSGAELYRTDTLYGLSKRIIQQSILEKENFYNVRVFGIFDENELDSRFIKSNILRYINKESLVVLEDKRMDFFYMEDFVRVMRLFIEKQDLPKEVDCSYFKSLYLTEIAEYINTLSTYKVSIDIQSSDISENYVGTHTPLPIKYTGLLKGIDNVYDKLLTQYTVSNGDYYNGK